MLPLRPAGLALVGLTALVLGGCREAASPTLPGTLEWNRIALVAEVSEPVSNWAVAEGDEVIRGETLLSLDSRRLDARLNQAQGELDQARAQLAELANGPRRETLDAARANLERAQAAARFAEQDYQRNLRLRRQQAVSQASLDQAQALRDERRAEVASLSAQLAALNAGERPERIAAARRRWWRHAPSSPRCASTASG